MTSRSYVFTYNNPPSNPLDFKASLEAAERIRYGIFQLEEGENGTPHYQGYLEFTTPTRMGAKWLRTILPGAHLEKRKGSRKQARDYCKKEDTRKDGPWEVGEWKAGGSGARNDLQGIIDSCKTGSLKRVAEEHPEGILRYSK